MAGIVLAGGKNSRMGGRDKAFLRVAGQPIFERTLDLFQKMFAQVVVVSNAPQKYCDYPVEVVTDEIVGAGPMSGIHAGMGRVRCAQVFVAACDMPYLRPEPIEYLVRRIADHEAVIPIWDGDIEPLHAIYATALRGRMEAALRRGVRAIRDFLPEARVDYVPEEDLRRVRGAAESFCNVNTPEEAARHDIQQHSVGR